MKVEAPHERRIGCTLERHPVQVTGRRLFLILLPQRLQAVVKALELLLVPFIDLRGLGAATARARGLILRLRAAII
jgi:hypothetical protein